MNETNKVLCLQIKGSDTIAEIGLCLILNKFQGMS